MEMKYEETLTAFVDFLGFSEASRELNEAARLQVLQLLLSLVSLRSEFSAVSTPKPDGSTSYSIRPAISTFSDHVIISYGLETLISTGTIEADHLPFFSSAVRFNILYLQ
jgi:hypothetical protein